MKMKQCENGHFYDRDKYALCPHCMAEKTKGIKKAGEQQKHTVLLGQEKTVLLGQEKTVLLEQEHTVLLPEYGESTALTEEPTKSLGELTEEPSKKPEELTEEEKCEIYRSEAQKRCLNCMEEYDTAVYDVCPHCGFIRGTGPSAAFQLHPGMGLKGRYVIGTALGLGGFGITYQAWDCKLKTIVAIKEYYPSGIVNRIPGRQEVILYSGEGTTEFQRGLNRFLEEARTTAKFSSHPNIVHVFDYFEENGTAYMVMELLKGMNLQQYMELHGGKIPWEEAVSIFGFAAEAVKEIHRKNMLHRDLSPDNLFICEDGTVKIIDLGAARFSSESEEVERTVILKLGMAPPEQYLKKGKQGPWTDVYALSAALYWAVTGCEPEESTDREREDLLKSPKELVPGLPDYLERTILKGMALLPELRFKDMTQFKKALLNENQVMELQKELEKRKRHRRIGILFSVLLIAAAADFGWRNYTEKKAQAFLEDAAITAWFPLREGQSEEEGRELWASMISEFQENYPQVSITTTFFPKEQYEEELTKALREGKQEPTLFESTGIREEQMEAFASVSGALKLLELGDYYFLSDYPSYFPEGKQLPLGFCMAVLYQNDILTGENAKAEEDNRLEQFLERKSPVCVADTSYFYEVQNSLPGIYSVQSLPGGEDVGAFTDLWSVNGFSTEVDQHAAVRLLYYFLSENVQDVLHISNQGAMPLMRSQADVFFNVNQEFLPLKKEITGLRMVEPEVLDAEEAEIYQDMRDSGRFTSDYEEEKEQSHG